MKKLDYRFGDDGLFWMSYDDLRSRFDLLDRTRLFDEKWTVVQHWTSVSVAWVTGYLNTKFQVEIKKAGPTVFVLCQVCLADALESNSTDILSSTIATSKASKVNTASICTFYFRKRAQQLVNISYVLVVPGLETAASPLKSTLNLASTRSCLRL